MTTAAEQLNFISEYASRGIRKFRAEIEQARTDCDDLRRENAELQRQNDILNGRVNRLNALLVLREREIEALRNGEIDAAQLGY